ncbi:auxin-responsive protein SAUR72-like [Sesamum indicum]|uniref:Auxin-responsive protein SAUR72-like n=1 Tax=Sesamum indicum TaxID=4182 RepID=A0A6I9SMU7_SESIN|nr:auxin-responsive protein SAUR72-like [Sesamum indicum]
MEYCPIKGEGKKGIISRAWERCISFSGGIGRKARNSSGKLKMKSKSWPRGLTDSVGVEIGKKWRRVAPEGCFSIYVGPQKQRFVIKTEYVNHPLFRDLLEEAESEYGYSSEGPLLLPCEVDRFLGVLDQMDFEDNIRKHKSRNFVATRVIGAVTTSLITPPRFLAAVDN